MNLIRGINPNLFLLLLLLLHLSLLLFLLLLLMRLLIIILLLLLHLLPPLPSAHPSTLPQIDCCIKLSGMPDLTLSFMNPRLFDDVSFHPCVRFKRWEAERLLSFIPPDGNFRLMSYHISSQSVVAIPIYIRHNFSIKTGEQGRLDLTIGPRNTLGRTVDKVKLELTMPRCVLNCILTPNQGKYTFDSVSKTLSWDVGRIDVSKLPNIRGTVRKGGGRRRVFMDSTGCSIVSASSFPGLHHPRQHQHRCEPINQCAIPNLTACRLWVKGQSPGHVRGEVQTLQGCQVSNQSWQIPGAHVATPTTPPTPRPRQQSRLSIKL